MNYSPVFFLEINGVPADDLMRRCTKISVKRTKGKSVETKLTFRNDDRTLGDDPRLFPNTQWRYRYGFFAEMRPMSLGIIRNYEPNYAMKRSVTVTLFDAISNLAVGTSSKNWGKVPSSKIAQQIAKNAGFTSVVEESPDKPKKDYIQQASINDLQFLRDLAAQIDYEVFVEETTLYYRKKPYNKTPVGVLVYYDDPSDRANVLSVKPKVKSLGAVKSGLSSATQKAATDSGDKSAQSLGTKLMSFSVENDKGARTIISAPPKAISKPAPSGANTAGLSAAARQQMLDKCNEMTSDHPFSPSIQEGEVYEWRGLDKQLNGKWYADEVEDDIDGKSSSTKVTWKRNSKNEGKKDAKNKNNTSAGAGAAPVLQVSGSDKSRTVVVPQR